MKKDSLDILRALYGIINGYEAMVEESGFYLDRNLDLQYCALATIPWQKQLGEAIQTFNFNCKLQDEIPAVIFQRFLLEDKQKARAKRECPSVVKLRRQQAQA